MWGYPLNLAVPTGPPKHLTFRCFFLNFIDISGFGVDFIKTNILIYGNWARMIAEWSGIFLNVILVLDIASKINFGPRNWNFHFFEKSNFQFSSITHFFNHKIQDPSCRICSYGPHGPFWFSVKKWPDTVKRYQKTKNVKTQFLRLSRKWINSSGVSSEKLPFVRMLPQGLLFLISIHLYKFKTCPFWKKCAFPHIWAFPFHLAWEKHLKI